MLTFFVTFSYARVALRCLHLCYAMADRLPELFTAHSQSARHLCARGVPQGRTCLLAEGPRELLHEAEVLVVDAARKDVVKVVLELGAQGLGDLVRPAERVQLPLLLPRPRRLHNSARSSDLDTGHSAGTLCTTKGPPPALPAAFTAVKPPYLAGERNEQLPLGHHGKVYHPQQLFTRHTQANRLSTQL